MSVTINNIEFKNISGLDKTSSKFAFVNKTGVSSTVFTNMAPSSTSEQYISRYALLNGLQIDWNGAQVAGQTLNTTGEMLSILQTAYNYATTYTGKTTLTSSSVLGTINGQSLKFGGSITIETGSGSYYVLPPATNSTLGGVIVGDGLTVSNGKISLGDHSVTSNKYGIGNSTKYGHVRIDDYNGNEDSAATDTALSLLGANQIVSYINSYYTPKTSYTALYNAFVSLEQRVAALENSPTVPPTVTPGPSNIPVTSVAFKQDKYSLKGKNTHLTVEAYVLPSNANVGTTITYQTYSNGTSGTLTSSNNIISVSSTGLVTPKAVGTATIVATANSKTANATITVSEADVTSVYVTGPTELTTKGQTITLTAYANPKDALFNTGVNWLPIPTAYSAYVSISSHTNTKAQIKCVSLPSENISVPITAASTVKSTVSKQYTITVKGNVTPILQNITGAPTSYKEGAVTLGISNTSSFNSSAYFTWKIETTLGGSLEVTTDTSSQTPASSGTVVTPGTSQSASTIVRADLGENVIFHYPQNNSSSAVTHTISCTETTTSARATINVVVPAKPAEQTKYFWYAGQTKPTSMTSNPTPDDTNFTNNKWHTLAKNATSIAKTITGGTSGNAWYIAVPTSFGFKPTATDLATPNNTWSTEGTIIINNVEYTLWKPSGTSSRQAVYMAKI